jgi:DNA-binding NarL/FixJ family response regulator
MSVFERRVRVLLADDHRLFLDALQLALSAEDWIEVVGCAENGEEAVELVGSLRPDIVLMDIAMPVLDGIEATRRIRERFPASAVVILTGTAGREGNLLAHEVGASGFVQKTGELPDLVGSILALAAFAGTRLH